MWEELIATLLLDDFLLTSMGCFLWYCLIKSLANT
jgi:hypothetical protein